MNTEADLHDNLFGIPYVAPEIIKTYKAKLKQDNYTKYSDVYSLGVLLWQISSGKPPFEDRDNNMLYLAIMSGDREKRISGTPDRYYNLYNQCWNEEPEARPTLEYIYDTLEKFLKKDYEKGKVDDSDNNNEGELILFLQIIKLSLLCKMIVYK